jgi:hypothetical protein
VVVEDIEATAHRELDLAAVKLTRTEVDFEESVTEEVAAA